MRLRSIWRPRAGVCRPEAIPCRPVCSASWTPCEPCRALLASRPGLVVLASSPCFFFLFLLLLFLCPLFFSLSLSFLFSSLPLPPPPSRLQPGPPGLQPPPLDRRQGPQAQRLSAPLRPLGLRGGGERRHRLGRHLCPHDGGASPVCPPAIVSSAVSLPAGVQAARFASAQDDRHCPAYSFHQGCVETRFRAASARWRNYR